MTGLDQYCSVADYVVSKEIESKKVLLNLDNGNYYTLNATASFIFDQCDGKTTLEQIAAALAGRFDIPLEEARKDVIDLIEDLEREGIAEADASPR